MAGHLAASGRTVWVWNRTRAKAEALTGVQIAESPADLCRRCPVVIVCVSRSEDVREVVSACLEGADGERLFVDHSTISPRETVSLQEELAELGHDLVDAPITGGSVGAQNGTLTIFVGGVKPAADRAIPLMQPYAKRAEWVGGPGRGQWTKLANQIAVAGALQGLCESLAFAQRAGLDIGLTRDLIAGGAGGSWAFDHYGPKVLARDWSPGFSIENQLKDFAYCREAAEEIGALLPGMEVTDEGLRALLNAGHGEWTTAALFEYLARGRPPHG